MKRIPIEEKQRIAEMLSHPDRPLQQIQNQKFPGLAAQRKAREMELLTTTAMEKGVTVYSAVGNPGRYSLGEGEGKLRPLSLY